MPLERPLFVFPNSQQEGRMAPSPWQAPQGTSHRACARDDLLLQQPLLPLLVHFEPRRASFSLEGLHLATAWQPCCSNFVAWPRSPTRAGRALTVPRPAGLAKPTMQPALLA